jgi:FtsH-binding integral membrane protein
VTTRPARRHAAFWWTATAIVAVILFFVADSDTIYNATSPATLDFHVLLRKAYSIVAFALLGWLAARASQATGWRTSPLTMGWWLALFSLAIEIAQSMQPPSEGLAMNTVDVACGWIGGWLGARVARRFM